MSITEEVAVPTERLVNGHRVPVAGIWNVDAAHSSVEFVARHLMVSKLRGRFSDYEATVTIAEEPTESSVVVRVAVDSISTGDEGRDAHLKNADFFDSANFPSMSFVSTGVKAVSEEAWKVDGDLTVRGITKPVVLDVEFGGTAVDPWGNAKAFFSASTEVDRESFGLTWNQPLAGGGVLVGKKVRIELEIEASPA